MKKLGESTEPCTRPYVERRILLANVIVECWYWFWIIFVIKEIHTLGRLGLKLFGRCLASILISISCFTESNAAVISMNAYILLSPLDKCCWFSLWMTPTVWSSVLLLAVYPAHSCPILIVKGGMSSRTFFYGHFHNFPQCR